MCKALQVLLGILAFLLNASAVSADGGPNDNIWIAKTELISPNGEKDGVERRSTTVVAQKKCDGTPECSFVVDDDVFKTNSAYVRPAPKDRRLKFTVWFFCEPSNATPFKGGPGHKAEADEHNSIRLTCH